jgi:hypothetical protein
MPEIDDMIFTGGLLEEDNEYVGLSLSTDGKMVSVLDGNQQVTIYDVNRYNQSTANQQIYHICVLTLIFVHLLSTSYIIYVLI